MCSPAGTTPATRRATAYERFARLSPDNGATWGNDEVMSDAVSPLPLQPDAKRPALLHGRLRPQLRERGRPLRLLGRRARADQRHRPSRTSSSTSRRSARRRRPSPNLVHDLTTLFDGNSNGYIDPGESFGLDERIRNAGNAGCHTGSAACSPRRRRGSRSRPANSNYPNIPAGGNGTNPTRFPGSASNTHRLRRRRPVPPRA